MKSFLKTVLPPVLLLLVAIAILWFATSHEQSQQVVVVRGGQGVAVNRGIIAISPLIVHDPSYDPNYSYQFKQPLPCDVLLRAKIVRHGDKLYAEQLKWPDYLIVPDAKSQIMLERLVGRQALLGGRLTAGDGRDKQLHIDGVIVEILPMPQEVTFDYSGTKKD